MDIGSGSNPQGTVNIDLYTGKSPHHHNIINPKNTSNFIQASITHIPLKNRAFTTAYASHVIEHLTDPSKGIKELKRVSRYRVIIKVPNNPYTEFKHHYFTWSYTSLQKYLRLFFKKVEVYPYTNTGSSRFILWLENQPNDIIRKLTKRLSRGFREVIGLELVAVCR